MSLSDMFGTVVDTVQEAINTVNEYSSAQTGSSSAQTGWYDSSGGGGGYEDTWWYGGGYGGYGGGGGGGGGGKSAEEVQKETQAQINNTVANYGGRGKDMSDIGQSSLKDISNQINQNNAAHKQTNRNIMQQIQWQPNQQKQQSTLSALRNRMGNSAYGSAIQDLREGLGRVDDMNDVNLINTWRENSNAAYNDWFQANEDLISDYIDQVNSIKDEFSKLYSQYWSTLSNINPELASEENVRASSEGRESSVGEDTDHYKLPGNTGVVASEDLKKLYQAPERASAINKQTYDYIRPSYGAYRIGGGNGIYNSRQAANRGFIDNLAAFRRV